MATDFNLLLFILLIMRGISSRLGKTGSGFMYDTDLATDWAAEAVHWFYR